MPEEILPGSNPNEPQPRRRRRSHSSSGRSHSHGSSRRHRKSSSSSSSSNNKFTFAQGFLLLWSAATLGTLLYLIGDVHRAPLPAIVGLAGAAILGLLLFFRGLRKKKRK